jgi:AcrR family transcriptional regulator
MVLPTPEKDLGAQRRARRSEATRDAILLAVRRLVVARGIEGTSVKEIAAEAGVALQTIYDLFGSKTGALLALVDHLHREAEIPPLKELESIDDPRALLQVFAGIRRRLLERCGDVFRAARGVSDPDFAAARREGERRHEAGLRAMVKQLRRLGALRREISDGKAVALLDAFSIDEQWDVLVGRHRWSPAEFEEWLVEMLGVALLSPATTKTRRR